VALGDRGRELIAKRAAQELVDGQLVNLGIGIPTAVADYVPQGVNIIFHAENGIIGTGPTPPKGKEDPNLSNAGGLPVTLLPGGVYMDSAESFAIVRGGYLDICMLGALQVSESGDLANWIIPGKRVPGMGGGMELAAKARKVVVLTEHVDKRGNPKIVEKCSLPLTAKNAANLIITDLAVIVVKKEGLFLKEVMPGSSVEEVINKTEAKFINH